MAAVRARRRVLITCRRAGHQLAAPVFVSDKRFSHMQWSVSVSRKRCRMFSWERPSMCRKRLDIQCLSVDARSRCAPGRP
jgi:hypothetical protein